MNIIPFHPEHATQIRLQPRQAQVISYADAAYAAALKRSGPSASAEHDGQIIACAGIAVHGFGIGTLWALVSPDIQRHAVRLDRALQRLIEIPNLRRIEAAAEKDFARACRWLEHLGFVNEGPLHRYGPKGEDLVRYARFT